MKFLILSLLMSLKHSTGFGVDISKKAILIAKKNAFLHNLSKRVKINFVFKKNSPTIVKKRYVDESSNSKTLGVYDLDDKNLESKNETQVLRYLIKNLNKFDLVIISDYGHGFITDKISKLISLKFWKTSKKIIKIEVLI